MSSQTVPFFSIITPVYNRSQCLPNAIHSVRNQDFADWEYVIVNDGSIDATAQIMDEAAAEDQRIISVHLPCNQGVSAARNKGIETARGAYLLFLDSDDEFKFGAFSLLHKLLNEENGIDMIIFPKDNLLEKSLCMDSGQKGNYRILSYDTIRGKLLAGLLGTCAHEKDHIYRSVMINKCIPKSILTDNGIFFDVEKVTWEDGEVFIKVVDKCKKILAVDDALMLDRTADVNDHLSMKYYSDGVTNILTQYKWFIDYFGKEFDFFNAFALNYHFNNIQLWIVRTIAKDKNRKALVLPVLRDADFIKLVTMRTPNGFFEKAVRFVLMHRWTYFAYVIYLLQNFINRGKCY